MGSYGGDSSSCCAHLRPCRTPCCWELNSLTKKYFIRENDGVLCTYNNNSSTYTAHTHNILLVKVSWKNRLVFIHYLQSEMKTISISVPSRLRGERRKKKDNRNVFNLVSTLSSSWLLITFWMHILPALLSINPFFNFKLTEYIHGVEHALIFFGQLLLFHGHSKILQYF